MKKLILMFLAILLIGAMVSPAMANFFATDWGSTSSLYRFDPATRTATLIGSTGQTRMIGLVTDQTNTIYAISEESNSRLWTLNPTTGAATLVGSLGYNLQEGDMTIDPATGNMYVADGIGDKLYTIDKTNGNTTLVGAFGAIGRDVSGLQFIGSTLYGLALREGLPNANALVTVDTGTGAATLVGYTGTNLGVIAAMGRDPATGTTYIAGPLTNFGSDNELYSLNLATGAATDLGAITGVQYSISGFSVAGNPSILTPEPTTILFLGSGLLGLLGLRRKFRK
jgi:DNA-binding beta-propeller fold protein YncE